MPALIYPAIPAAVPDDGDPEVYRSAREAADLRGDPSWDPQPNEPYAKGDPATRMPDRRSLLRVLGIGRPSAQPVPTPLQVRLMTGNLTNADQGAHAAFENEGAAETPQGMAPRGLRGNTWRAAPAPWDATFTYPGES